jgi:hypothetical protein
VARKKRSSNPKDRIFALYGVLRTLGIPIDAPDYSRSVQDTYTSTTSTAIARDNSLEIFHGCMGFGNTYCLPSWVPDWSAVAFIRLLIPRNVFEKSPKRVEYSLTNDVMRLTVYGEVVNVVHNASGIYTTLESSFADFRTIIQSWMAVCRSTDLTAALGKWIYTFMRLVLFKYMGIESSTLSTGCFKAWYELIAIHTDVPLKNQTTDEDIEARNVADEEIQRINLTA